MLESSRALAYGGYPLINILNTYLYAKLTIEIRCLQALSPEFTEVPGALSGQFCRGRGFLPVFGIDPFLYPLLEATLKQRTGDD